MILSLAIEHNRRALLRLVAMVLAGAGFVAGTPVLVSRGIRGTILYYLQPMEAAARRLIFVKAAGLVVTLRKRRAGQSGPIPRGTDAERVSAFRLIDPRGRASSGENRRYAKGLGPCVSDLYGSGPAREVAADKPAPDAPVDATQLCRRLQALKAALEDLPKQARRMALAQARRAAAPPGPRRVPPIRSGRPPGHRARGKWEVDEVLRECHLLALRVLSAPNTS